MQFSGHFTVGDFTYIYLYLQQGKKYLEEKYTNKNR